MRKNAKSFYDWCQENNKNYCDYWDYNLNEISPKEIGSTIKDKYYFKCFNGHNSFLKGVNNLVHSKDLICPICNSFYTWCMENDRQDLIDAWDDEIDITQISKCSGKKVKFNVNNSTIYLRIGDITNTQKNSDPIKKYYNSIGYYLISNYGEDAIEKYWQRTILLLHFLLTKVLKKRFG